MPSNANTVAVLLEVLAAEVENPNTDTNEPGASVYAPIPSRMGLRCFHRAC